MRIAFLADLHGNRPATEAAVAALASLCPDDVWFLGDAVGKGPSNDFCCDWVRAHCRHWVGGNWDYGVGARQFPADGYYWRQLGEERLSWLRSLPREAELTFGGVRFRLLHGRPVTELLRVQSPSEALEALFHTAQGDFGGVIFADSHRPFVRTLSSGYVINTGSIGNSMGVPKAHFLLLEDQPLRMTVVSVPYDNEAAVADALREKDLPKREAYIREIQTGIYSR